MGGKQKKQANRTKGNTRPSSSSRSAVRLMQVVDGSSARSTGFVGLHQQQLASILDPFGSITGLISGVAINEPGTSTATMTTEPDDGDCRMLMKKMSKKDSITRLKALQEFHGYCTSCSEDALKAALPFWPRLYNRLSSDFDRRVREAAHKAHFQLVSKAGRNLALHLKFLMGPWLMGASDPHVPAASAAIAAFAEAFKGPTKQYEALIFCKEDIINHISDVAFNQTPQSLCDSEICPPEESEATHCRLVSVALLALTSLLDTLPESEHSKSLQAYADLLQKPKFWKFPKSQETCIRAAWFRLMSAFCRIEKSILDPHLVRASPLILGSFDEEDPVVCQLVWEASLHLVVAQPGCWNHVNVQKAVIPKLLTIAKKGFGGNAIALCPSLLPLLSNIPENVLKEKHSFYSSLITSLTLGLALPNIQLSPSDCSAIVTALMECIRYVGALNADFEEEFVLVHILPIIEKALVDKSCTLSSTPLYMLVANYLSLKRGQPFEITFWNTFGPMCVSAAGKSNDENGKESILERVAYMFTCFARNKEESLDTSTQLFKKSMKRKVNFATTEGDVCANVDKKPEINVKRVSQVPDGHLLTVASQLCVSSQELYLTTKSVVHLEFLAKMIPEFLTPFLFRSLLHIDDGGDNDDDDLSSLAMRYFNVMLKQWLTDLKNVSGLEQTVVDTRIVAALVTLINIVVLPFVEMEDQFHVFDEVLLLDNVIVLEQFLRIMMNDSSHAEKREPAIRNMFKNSALGTTVIEFTNASMHRILTSATTNDDDRATWRLLTLCFESFDNVDPILSTEVLSAILDHLRTTILYLNSNEIASGCVIDELLTLVARLAAGLFNGMPNCWRISACEDILLAFFVLLCHPTSIIGADTMRILENFVNDSISLLLLSQTTSTIEPNGFLYKASKHIHDLQLKESLHRKIEVAKVFGSLLSTVQTTLLLNESSSTITTNEILDLALLDREEQRAIEMEITKRNFIDLVMQGELCVLSLIEFKDSRHSSRDFKQANDFKQLLMSAYIASEGLLVVLTNQHSTCEDRLLPHLLNVLFAFTYSKVCLRPTNKLISRDEISELQSVRPKLESNLKILIDRLPLKTLSKLLLSCKNLSKEHGFFWSYALIELECLIMFTKSDFIVEFEQIVNFQTTKMSQGALHNLQLHLIFKNEMTVSSESICRFINCALENHKNDDHIKDVAILTNCLCHVHVDDIPNVFDILSKFTEASHDVILSIQKCRLLTEICNVIPEKMTRDNWDYMFCALGNWLKRIDFEIKEEGRLLDKLFATSAFRLASSVSLTINRLKIDGSLDDDLKTEWDEFFAKAIYGRLLFLFVSIAETLNQDTADVDSLSCTDQYELEALAKSLIGLPASVVGLDEAGSSERTNELPTLLVPDWDDDDQATSVQVKTTLNHLCPLLEHRFCGIQFGAYHSLNDLLFNLTQCYNVTKIAIEDETKENEDVKQVAIPGPLLAVLKHKNDQMQAGSLAGVIPGDENNYILVDSDHPDCSVVIGFLLVWDLTLRMFSQASSEIRSLNAYYFRESGLIMNLLNYLFILMPSKVHLPDIEEVKSKTSVTRRTMFTEEPRLDHEVPRSAVDIQHLACSMYMAAVRHVPALVRDWFNGLDRRTSSFVERFTVANVSHLLCSTDLAAVRLADNAHLLKGLKVRVRPGAREVLATCTIEDISFEIVVRLAENHPLGPITIEAGRPIGVSSSQWSYWTLQLTTFLMHQNGSILDGLLLWKRNIDKKFEGVQECYVCFYVLHGTTYQLPKHLCRTCKKKFHSSCLYKWFSTSGHSTCPLCRSIF